MYVGEKCRHLNDIRTDDKLSNLCWGTHGENIRDAVKNGRKLGWANVNCMKNLLKSRGLTWTEKYGKL